MCNYEHQKHKEQRSCVNLILEMQRQEEHTYSGATNGNESENILMNLNSTDYTVLRFNQQFEKVFFLNRVLDTDIIEQMWQENVYCGNLKNNIVLFQTNKYKSYLTWTEITLILKVSFIRATEKTHSHQVRLTEKCIAA